MAVVKRIKLNIVIDSSPSLSLIPFFYYFSLNSRFLSLSYSPTFTLLLMYPHYFYSFQFNSNTTFLSPYIRLSQDKSVPAFPLSSDVSLNNDYTARFYMRITCSDGKPRYSILLFSLPLLPSLSVSFSLLFLSSMVVLFNSFYLVSIFY